MRSTAQALRRNTGHTARPSLLHRDARTVAMIHLASCPASTKLPRMDACPEGPACSPASRWPLRRTRDNDRKLHELRPGGKDLNAWTHCSRILRAGLPFLTAWKQGQSTGEQRTVDGRKIAEYSQYGHWTSSSSSRSGYASPSASLVHQGTGRMQLSPPACSGLLRPTDLVLVCEKQGTWPPMHRFFFLRVGLV